MMVEDSMAATDNQGPFLRVHPVADTFTVVRYNMEKGLQNMLLLQAYMRQTRFIYRLVILTQHF